MPITAFGAVDAAVQSGPPTFLRVVEEKGKSIALEVAMHDFIRADESGPRVGLIAVAHIADKSFYESVAALLEPYDLVLYESVKPAGTGGAGGETDEERITSTKAAMTFVQGMVESHFAENKTYPDTIAALEKFAASKDPRIVQFLRTAMKDAWGRALIYQHIQVLDQEIVTTDYALISLGADGQPGGDGVAADIEIDRAKTPPANLKVQSGDSAETQGLQSQLASALGLEFQLTSLPYDCDNWRCSDMAMDEVNRRLAAKGLDFNLICGTLAGSSMPAKMIKLLLGFIKMADAFMEGAIADTMKVVMIEVLGDPRLVDQGLSQLGEGFGEVIINDRNQVVIDDLRALIEQEPHIKSVAVLYGAGHMVDLHQRLAEQLGYETAPEKTEWLPVIKVDLTQSKMSGADLERLRTMMRQAIRQQMRRK